MESIETLGLYKGEQLCYQSALVSSDENFSDAGDGEDEVSPPSKYFIGEPKLTYELSDPLFDRFKDDYSVVYLGSEEEAELSFVQRSGHSFEVVTDDIEHVGSYLYEFSGCDGEQLLVVYLKLDVALNTAPELSEWEAILDEGSDIMFELYSNETI